MTKPLIFEKPTGFRDFPPPLAARKRMMEELIQTEFAKWGYAEVGTPTLEFYETVGQASAIDESRMFKCMDREGNTLVLRPDQTAPIARVVTSLLKHEPLPLRLCYHANVFRAQENEAGRNSEFFQSGVELVGEAGAEADAEVIALSVKVLTACRVDSFQIALGHVGLLEGFLRERIEDDEALTRLKEQLGARNLVEFRKQLGEIGLKESQRIEIETLVQAGTTLDQIKRLTSGSRSLAVQEAGQHLEELFEYLDAYGCAGAVTLDLGLVGSLDYYTGVYFEGYAAGQGFPLLSGGRYDGLYRHFRRFLPATGFAVQLDHLLAACPLRPEPRETIGLFYQADRKKEALSRARQLREEGYAVATHLLAEEDGLPEIAKRYDRVVTLPEGKGEGGC
ncbi:MULTISPECIES: ATP phosphoribosyltransferase regulatory subunit [unclassified Thermoactinomyces]|uniref:ATP phosphoribosyltransferase regulatory subunit n=1 Tax=unclassified Thermoactinomyces TaxID=2634588 RepID=UPI0018DD8A30|nr:MULTISPECIES: ATP phosphoribosyltransferase regulatory subunit [unclassified Thermoactinomyces]MBH8605054.1 ATP phosphoribosyltransferase regulatory subunit [Thermoactinomyces sp. CICC 10522]MBH8606310.1 ATP phosphoribosyltransferase regulatory subunit [Thermoactinomyces sp. CICC 10521]